MTATRLPEAVRQRGAAAVEFALVLPALLLLLWGLITFATMFYTQLAVSRAASDGARTAAQMAGTPDLTVIRAEVIESLAASAVVPRSSNHSIEARRVWINDNVVITPTLTTCNSATCIVVRVQFPYNLTRVLPPIELPLISPMSWLPDTLVAEASALR